MSDFNWTPLKDFTEGSITELKEAVINGLETFMPYGIIIIGLILAVYVIEILIDLINDWRGVEREDTEE